MSTNRELYFQYKKEGIPDTVIYFALEEINGFDHLSLTKDFDKEIKDENQFVSAMNRYQNGEMIEYIFNKAYFLSKHFYVDKNVFYLCREYINTLNDKHIISSAHSFSHSCMSSSA